jgi:cytochrome c peroxidase
MTMRSVTFKLRLAVLFGFLSLSLFAALVRADGPDSGSNALEIKLPPGIPFEVWDYFVPKDNPVTAAKVGLGQELFFDKRLSADGTVSCATCHDPKLAFTDGKPVAEGIHGRKGSRSSPTLLNAMFNSGQFWDGRVESLESQSKLPLVNPDEMGNASQEQVAERLRAIPEYAGRFQQVFGDLTVNSLGKALASYERTLVTADSPFDRYRAGDSKAMSDEAKQGLFLFTGKARCTVCHTFNSIFASTQSFHFFTDQMYHNTGVAVNDPAYAAISRKAVLLARNGPREPELQELAKEAGASSLGRFLVTGNSLDIGAFKTPSLRNVELTAPYFHDGSAATLADVVEFYVKGGNHNPNRDWELQAVSLTDAEQADLVEFLKSLTSYDVRKSAADSFAKGK